MKGHVRLLLTFFIVVYSPSFSQDESIELGPKDEPKDDQSGNNNGYCAVDETCPNEERAEGEEQNEKDLADRGETSPSIFSKSWDMFKNVGRAAFETVYKLSEEVLEDIASIFRNVFNEEIYSLISNITSKAVGNIYDQNNVLTSVGSTILSVSILVAMLFLNYLLFSYISLLVLLALDGALFLLHGIYGPVVIGKWFIVLCGIIYELLKWIIQYPYLFSAGIVFIFAFSCIWPCIRRRLWCCKTSDDRICDMDERLITLKDRLEILIQKSEKRHKIIESKLTHIETILSNIKNEGSNIMNSEP